MAPAKLKVMLDNCFDLELGEQVVNASSFGDKLKMINDSLVICCTLEFLKVVVVIIASPKFVSALAVKRNPQAQI